MGMQDFALLLALSSNVLFGIAYMAQRCRASYFERRFVQGMQL